MAVQITPHGLCGLLEWLAPEVEWQVEADADALNNNTVASVIPEIRIPKSERNRNPEYRKGRGMAPANSDFGFRCSFDIRISVFGF